MALERQTAGQNFKFSAATWNAFCDTTEAVNSPDLSSVDKSYANKNTAIIWIKNTSGAARERFDVLMLDAPLIAPEMNENEFKNRVAFEAIALDDSASATPVILLQPLEDDACGRGVILGATVAKVEINNGTDGYAQYSSTHPEYLESTAASTNIKLLYNPGTGADFGVVLIGTTASSPNWHLGKLDGDLNYNSTATVSIWSGTINSESDSGENITGVGCRWLTTGKKLASGSWVGISSADGSKWYVTTGPCEVAQ